MLYWKKQHIKIGCDIIGVVYKRDMLLSDYLILLFKSKKCPYCNSKLKIINEKTLESNDGVTKVGYTSFYGKVFNIKTYLHCDDCDKDFQVSEL